MSSLYLQPQDYDVFGVSDATEITVRSVSTLIDAYLRRPSGLVYVADGNGIPCYMAALPGDLLLNANAAISPGANVVVTVKQPAVQLLQYGDPVILDRDQSSMEVAQIVGINAATNQITLAKVSQSHGANCAIESGFFCTEQKYLPKGRSAVRLSMPPVARIIAGTGRYAYGRRGGSAAYNNDSFNLLATVATFGGPPAWEIWPAANMDGVNRESGEVWVPAGLMLAYYTEVKIRYVAGWTYANLPTAIKEAAARLLVALGENPIIGDISKQRAGDQEVDQLTSSMLSDDVKHLLSPYRARVYG